jgi:hypothetical protein
MKEKLFDPARHNEQSPAEGMAAVNTHNAEERPIEETIAEQKEKDGTTDQPHTETKNENNRNVS